MSQLQARIEALAGSGLYAYTAIRAPRGLREEVFHVWRQEGQEVDRIALTIEGGREAGYRAWSRKQNFPDDPAGRWRIDVMTDSGQRIGVIRFRVTDDGEASLADGRELLSGVQGLGLRRLVPGRHDDGPAAEPTADQGDTPAGANGGAREE
ncbi:DUF2914 domain-containing protein [Halomonas alkalicola]|uniref:DUF2914 domain-containing protein n=1 Tax=Halomonas alkalicola TaxID=1930622 RepID=UPI0034E2F1CE